MYFSFVTRWCIRLAYEVRIFEVNAVRCVLDRGPTGKRTTTTTTTQAAPTRRESLVFAPGRRNLAAECQRAKHITHIAEPRSKSQPARCVWNWNGRNITALLQHSSTHTHGKGKASQHFQLQLCIHIRRASIIIILHNILLCVRECFSAS